MQKYSLCISFFCFSYCHCKMCFYVTLCCFFSVLFPHFCVLPVGLATFFYLMWFLFGVGSNFIILLQVLHLILFCLLLSNCFPFFEADLNFQFILALRLLLKSDATQHLWQQFKCYIRCLTGKIPLSWTWNINENMKTTAKSLMQ